MIEKQIEDLCLERLRLERASISSETDSIEDQAKAEAQRQIRQARIEAIDTQLEGLRKEYAREYADDRDGQYATLSVRLLKEDARLFKNAACGSVHSTLITAINRYLLDDQLMRPVWDITQDDDGYNNAIYDAFKDRPDKPRVSWVGK